MEKPNIVLILLFISNLGIVNGTVLKGPESMGKWLKTRYPARERVTRLQFYVRHTLTKQTPTNVTVTLPNSTFHTPTRFGLIMVIDDLVTLGPESSSKIMGRAEGIIAFASSKEIGLHMTFTIVFTDGKYKASTLSFVGHNGYLTELRQISVVGGTGAFMLARGVTFINTVSSNSSSGDVFEYNVFVLHY